MLLTESFSTRETWLEGRRQGIGASDAAAVFGVSPYLSPLALFHTKRGNVPITEAEREALHWGRVLQSPIARRYADETKRLVDEPPEYEIRRHPTEGYMLATLDALATPTPQGKLPPADGPGVVEIKNVGFFRRDEWQDEPPLHVLIQANHQMFVTGLQWASVAALVGGNTFVYADIRRNNAFIEILVKRCKEFWERVEHDHAPDPDASESTKQLLKALYPTELESVTSLGNEFLEVDAELERIKKEQKALEIRRDIEEAKLKLAIGTAAVGTLPNGAAYTYRTVRETVVQSFTRKAYRALKRVESKVK